jgi:P27 family predicted phage terminase small subunit
MTPAMPRRAVRKPTALRLLEGDRSHRPRNTREPMPDPIAPPKPETLSDGARVVWDEYAPDLERHGLLTALDGVVFETFCEALAAHRRSVALIKPALLVKGRRDALVVNPGWRVFRDSALLVYRLGAEFGLSPASRASLTTGEPVEFDDDLFYPRRH